MFDGVPSPGVLLEESGRAVWLDVSVGRGVGLDFFFFFFLGDWWSRTSAGLIVQGETDRSLGVGCAG